MGDEIKEECALAAVSLHNPGPKKHAALNLYKMLLQQQHRGQLSAGITTYNPDRTQLIDTYKKLGKVDNAFKTYRREKFLGIMKKYAGSNGIGHLRYATSGADDEGYAQPFERHHGRSWKWFSFAFNGNIANYKELKEELKKASYRMVRELDTELLMHFISKQMVGEKKQALENVFSGISETIDGAYSLVYLNADGELAVLRDPLGFKPLSYGMRDNDFLAASESVAFNTDGEIKTESVAPGEIIIASNGAIEKKRFAKSTRTAHCMFEWIYFASPNSTIERSNVYEARRNLGKTLAKYETQKIDKEFIVVPVPDTAKPIGDALAFELGVPSEEGVMRNRYIGRTFIETDNREQKVKEKYSLVKSVLKDKKVLLVEDSLVRGTTTKGLVQRIRQHGKAKEIHLRIACPPILGPCFYGIDMSTIKELLAAPYVKSIQEGITTEESEKLAKDYGVDSLIYLPVNEIPKAIGLPANNLCMACLNADYPTEQGKKLYQEALNNAKNGVKKRTYE
ncbi:MAG: amidophosphoribosyltransferase [Candidatus Diapherotrites archaeon]|uniref:Amidophosphoribosyltransferase n=1 Tax=Candidatus Iainarchaeum sp. TaxID=3101447 RepID=A0A938YX26_9ARCH|nr:amidophosphoribosyltransferase [Candidatus Diapherotrites archaeon]